MPSLSSSPETISQWLHSFDHLQEDEKAHRVPGSDVKRVLGLYGLKTAQHVHEFLESPEGKEVKVRIYKEIAAHEAIMDAMRLKAQDDLIKAHRALAYLLMQLSAKKAKARKEYNAELDRQIQKDLARNKVVQDQETIKLELPAGREWELMLEGYEISEEIIHIALQHSLLAAERVEEEIAEIDRKQLKLTQKYNSLQALLNEHDAYLETIYQQSNPEQSIQLINQRLETFNPVPQNKLVGKRIHQQAAEIHRQQLENILGVLKNEKRMYDASGNKVIDFRQAAFFVPSHYQLRMQDQHIYLFEHENELTNRPVRTPHLIDRAHKIGLHQHRDMLGTQQLLLMKQAQDMSRLEKRRNVAEEKRLHVLEDVAKFSKALIDIHDAKLFARERVAAYTSHNYIPRPQPAFQEEMKASYVHMLKLMKLQPTPQVIDSLKATAKAAQVKDLPLQTALNGLKPGSIVPQETMNLLNQGARFFGGPIRPQPVNAAVRPEPKHSFAGR
ncbi:coiled coil protein [Legionella quinlivanii]|uniref:Coiled coil protein n=1 Tax=Legionella quinlivanii TaxID=45073 RepID=A0A0W0Y172_9GAMM|nr:hypothetical protein [Legionella quinlivanii]KTD50390.1 coiled coil protein [Legionella quinlivanii]SEF41524.1 hypothetical protein SAMN02746093_00110 [Legionella quinlivanii DSM 21216]STY11990.1 coiled coil protein [Legionella quinlivanii]